MFCVNPECPDVEATGQYPEFVDGIAICPSCGARLVEQPGDQVSPQSGLPDAVPREAETVTIVSTTDPSELAILETILSGAEIPYLVEGLERYSTFRGGDTAFRFLPAGGSVSIVVPADRAEEARIIISTDD